MVIIFKKAAARGRIMKPEQSHYSMDLLNSLLKVTLQDGTAEIIAMETMSAMPIEDKVAMAMGVIPREGVTAIQAGTQKIQVMPYQ